MKKRAFITLTLAVDLDMVAGPWDKPSDWVDLLQNSLEGAKHYNPKIAVHQIYEVRYIWSEHQQKYKIPEIEVSLDLTLQSEPDRQEDWEKSFSGGRIDA